ncbi:MAG: hypothetical protein E6G60_01015 [Actinobacteria bacterium]|nr:MAG: hypothetical protein E6G60_01015 [Actinomycetota bacterium]
MDDESVLDPWVAEWLDANPLRATPLEDVSPEMLAAARSPMPLGPPTREIASVTDDVVDNVPIRIYRGDGPPTGLVVYFHGGAFAIGSIALMDNVARELAHGSGAVVASVEYRLAPEHPFPAGLDDCETVTRCRRSTSRRSVLRSRGRAPAATSPRRWHSAYETAATARWPVKC